MVSGISFIYYPRYGFEGPNRTHKEMRQQRFGWILVIVDAFSKKMITVSMKDKSALCVYRALSKIYKKIAQAPSNRSR